MGLKIFVTIFVLLVVYGQTFAQSSFRLRRRQPPPPPNANPLAAHPPVMPVPPPHSNALNTPPVPMQAPPAHAAQHTPPTAAENTHHELPDIGIHEEEQHPHAAPAVANIHHDVAPHFEEPQHQAPHNAHHNVVNNAQLPEGAAGHQVHAPPTLGPSENVNENEEQQQAGSSQTTQSAGVNNQQEILNQMFMSGQDNIAEIVNGIIAALGI